MDPFLLLTPFLVLALVALLVFAGCGLAHAVVARRSVIVSTDFDPTTVGQLNLILVITITRVVDGAMTTATVRAAQGMTPTVDDATLTVTGHPGERGTRRLDFSLDRTMTPPSAEIWTVDCRATVFRVVSTTAQNGSVMDGPRTLGGSSPDVFGFVIDTSNPASVTVRRRFP